MAMSPPRIGSPNRGIVCARCPPVCHLGLDLVPISSHLAPYNLQLDCHYAHSHAGSSDIVRRWRVAPGYRDRFILVSAIHL